MNNNWQPLAELETLKRRAQFIADVRLFFARKGVLEVDTPILSQAAPTAPYLDSFKTHYIPLGTAQEQAYYLQTSPEFTMKRLLAAGSGAIYQIAKVFRNGEQGKYHSPEFSMLEWYRPGFSLEQLMDEIDELLATTFSIESSTRLTYQQVFKQLLNVNVFICSDDEIRSLAKQHLGNLSASIQLDRDGWLELLMSEVIEPNLMELDQAVFITDFPASQAQLANIKIDRYDNKVAARFELYAGGLELANGYDELVDADELRDRFEQDNQQRQLIGKAEMPIDENLLDAMTSGLPSCSGVALGIDRLLMLGLNKPSIAQVQSFDLS